jgi:hypothetical protein
MITERKKGYKVVRKGNHGRLTSVLGSMGGPAGWYPEYVPGQDTCPYEGCGPLAVFDSLYEATDYYEGDVGWDWYCELWECEYVPSDHVHPQGFVLWWQDLGGGYWASKTAGVTAGGLPPGTAFAEIVRLTRRVRISRSELQGERSFEPAEGESK